MNLPNVPARQVQGFGDGRVSEAVRPSLEPEGFSELAHRVVDTLPGQPLSLRGPVEIQEKRSRFISPHREPILKRVLCLGRKGEPFSLHPALSHDGDGPGFQVHVCNVQGNHFGPSQAQVIQQPGDCTVASALAPLPLFQRVQHENESISARPPRVSVGLRLDIPHFQSPGNQAESAAQFHQGTESGKTPVDGRGRKPPAHQSRTVGQSKPVRATMPPAQEKPRGFVQGFDPDEDSEALKVLLVRLKGPWIPPRQESVHEAVCIRSRDRRGRRVEDGNGGLVHGFSSP